MDKAQLATIIGEALSEYPWADLAAPANRASLTNNIVDRIHLALRAEALDRKTDRGFAERD